MVMEIEIVSEEYIKPSSPTPPHLRTFKYSLLDQTVAPLYVPMVIFYNSTSQETVTSATEMAAKRSQFLKQSLSNTLSHLYPLAGRTKDNLSIDCNDEGVYFAEAKVNEPLCEIKDKLDPTLASKFLPGFAWRIVSPGANLARIQVTNFVCGGFTIAVLVSHMVADAASLNAFLKFWAAMATKSVHEVESPNFDASLIFPPNGSFSTDAIMSFIRPFITTGRCATKRLVFDASTIASLKEKTRSPNTPNPSRVEVISAHLCKCILSALESKSGRQKQLLITHAVNIRRRAVPPLPECSIGNLVLLAPTLFKGDYNELNGLVFQMRKAISKIDGKLIKSIQDVEGMARFWDSMIEFKRDIPNDAVYIGFSSWCNMGQYEIDFGWGKPFWVTTCGDPAESTISANRIYLMDHRDGRGIEACLCLTEEAMAAVEQSEELSALTSQAPSPLI